MTSFCTPLALLLLVAAVLLAAGCTAGDHQPLIEIPGKTTVLATGVTSPQDLEAKGLNQSSLLPLFPAIRRYDVVTFDWPVGRMATLEKDMAIRIQGKEYHATFRARSPDGKSYVDVPCTGLNCTGTLSEDPDSSIRVSTWEGFIVGSITVNGETFWIMPVDKEAGYQNQPRILHVIYNARDAPGFPNPGITYVGPSRDSLHYYQHDDRSGISYLTRRSRISTDNYVTDGKRILWTWNYYGMYSGLTLYSIPDGNFTDIPDKPFDSVSGLFSRFPLILSGDYIVWADRKDCVSPNRSYGLILYNITSSAKTCIAKNAENPVYAEMSGNYVVWEDSGIYLYDIRTGMESVILPNRSKQEYPTVDGDRVAWYDARNYPPLTGSRDLFFYNLTDGSLRVINTAPVHSVMSAPAIFRNSVIWNDYNGTGSRIRVHVYDIPSRTDRVLDETSIGNPISFSGSGNFVVWQFLGFRQGEDTPTVSSRLIDLKKGTFVPACGNSELKPVAIGGTILLVHDSEGYGFCRIPPQEETPENAGGSIS